MTRIRPKVLAYKKVPLWSQIVRRVTIATSRRPYIEIEVKELKATNRDV